MFISTINLQRVCIHPSLNSQGALDDVHPSPFNLSLAYGAASVPFVAAKYNMITRDIYSYFKLERPGADPGTFLDSVRETWHKKIAPGLIWSYARDTTSVGGAIVLGPYVATWLQQTVDGTEGELQSDTKAAAYRFASG